MAKCSCESGLSHSFEVGSLIVGVGGEIGRQPATCDNPASCIIQSNTFGIVIIFGSPSETSKCKSVHK